MALKKLVADGSMYVWSLLRIALGFIFLWAFFDKLFGLGVSTCAGKGFSCSAAWLQGGSPTEGFLGHGVTGPFTDFYNGLAGQAWVDWAFMLGLAVAGAGLLLGIFVRFASFIGIAMLMLMWTALLWPKNTPGIDEHIIYALVLFGVALSDENQMWSLRRWWVKTSLAKALPFLR